MTNTQYLVKSQQNVTVYKTIDSKYSLWLHSQPLGHHRKSKRTTTVFQKQSCTIWHSATFSQPGPLEHSGTTLNPERLRTPQRWLPGLLAHLLTCWHDGTMAETQLNGTGTQQTSDSHPPICMDISQSWYGTGMAQNGWFQSWLTPDHKIHRPYPI